MGRMDDTRLRGLRVALGADHRGYPLKEALGVRLQDTGVEVMDLGTHGVTPSVDYTDIARRVALAVRDGTADFGVMICHTGQGSCMTANKVRGVRAALVWAEEIARLARAHNDARVICFPGSFLSVEVAWRSLVVFLSTPFEGGRHARRVAKMEEETTDPCPQQVSEG